jgi:hypothetical protein
MPPSSHTAVRRFFENAQIVVFCSVLLETLQEEAENGREHMKLEQLGLGLSETRPEPSRPKLLVRISILTMKSEALASRIDLARWQPNGRKGRSRNGESNFNGESRLNVPRIIGKSINECTAQQDESKP